MAAVNAALTRAFSKLGGGITSTLASEFKAGAKSIDALDKKAITSLNKEFGNYVQGAGADMSKLSEKELDTHAQGFLSHRYNSAMGRLAPDVDASHDMAIAFDQIHDAQRISMKSEAITNNYLKSTGMSVSRDEVENAINHLANTDGTKKFLKTPDLSYRNQITDHIADARATAKVNSNASIDPRDLDIYHAAYKSTEYQLMRDVYKDEASAYANFDSKVESYRARMRQPDDPAAPLSVDEAAARKKGGFNGMYNYLKNREAANYNLSEIKKGYVPVEDQEALTKKLDKLTGKQTAGMSDIDIQDHLNAALHQRASSANVLDQMRYHKVPQAAAGIGATAWLVSKMSNSRGQMSNSQLYGQSSPYGM